MVFTVFSKPADCSCVLVFRADPCWNVSICKGFCASRSEQHVSYGVFACFQKALFGQVQSYMLLRIKSQKTWLFYGVLAGFQKAILPPGPLSSAALFLCPVSACYFDSVRWAGGGGYVRNKQTGYCAPCRLVFSIIVSKSEPPKPYTQNPTP